MLTYIQEADALVGVAPSMVSRMDEDRQVFMICGSLLETPVRVGKICCHYLLR
jgi:hypothetical protein